jgi:primary-amine oxidase
LSRAISIRHAWPGVFAAAALAILTAAPAAAAAAVHPLDPLDADELATIGAVVKRSGRFSADANFAWVALQEPDKAVVQAFKPGMAFPRRATLDAIDYAQRKAFAVVVDVKAREIVSVTDLAGLQPGLTDRDTDIAKEVLDADPRIKAALVARGLDVRRKVSESVGVQYAPIGHDPSLAQQDGRLMRAFFASDQDAINEFSPFLDGLSAVVDLYARQVVRLQDEAGAPRIAVPHDIFDRKVRGPAAGATREPRSRDGRKSVSVERNVIRWRNWQLRYAFNLREGLVLYQVGFEDQGRRRLILYRASVSEIVTAYGDATDFWSWLELYDEGVFGLGASAVAVEPGREVPANALVLDPVLPDVEQPRFSARPPRRIYVYERDAGSLMYYRQGDLTFHARARELVVGSLASFGNYVYGINWIFREDGSFRFEADLAGEVLTKFVRQQTCETCRAMTSGPGAGGESRPFTPDGDDRYGTLVHPGLVAANHQHWFNLRLDFDIDGAANAVMENNRAHAASPRHDAAEARALTASHTVLGTSVDAARDMNEETGRSWSIYNPAAVSREGRPAGYTLAPMENAMTIFPPMRQHGSAAFTAHHVWITPYRAGELFAGGPYPNQAPSDYTDTLARYASPESIYDRDIVVWYSLGMTHFPRPEDYPVMSSARLSVTFQPDGFFSRNPAVGLGQVSGQ